MLLWQPRPSKHACIACTAWKVSNRGAIFISFPVFRERGKVTAGSIPKQHVYLTPLMHAGGHTPLLKLKITTYPVSPVTALQILCRKGWQQASVPPKSSNSFIFPPAWNILIASYSFIRKISEPVIFSNWETPFGSKGMTQNGEPSTLQFATDSGKALVTGAISARVAAGHGTKVYRTFSTGTGLTLSRNRGVFGTSQQKCLGKLT